MIPEAVDMLVCGNLRYGIIHFTRRESLFPVAGRSLVTSAAVPRVRLKRQQKEETRKDIGASDNSRNRLRMDRMSGEQQAGDHSDSSTGLHPSRTVDDTSVVVVAEDTRRRGIGWLTSMTGVQCRLDDVGEQTSDESV